jgi:Flp pilus assembly protein protease CpaA
VSLLVLPWLLVCAISDLRTRTVPTWLTVVPLLGATAWIAWQGDWPLALLVLTLVALDDLHWRARGFLAGVQGLLLLFTWQLDGLAGLMTGLALLAIWLCWKLGAFGGADAQVLMSLTLLFQPGVLLPVALAGGLQGLVQWLRKKSTLPAMLAILTGTFFYLVFPKIQ